MLNIATFSLILTGLRAIIIRNGSSVPGHNDLLALVHARLGRLMTRFDRLFTQWRTGTLPPPRAPRPSKPGRTRAPYQRLPTRRWWLVAALKSHHANAHGGQLQHLLKNAPEMQQFLQAVPRALNMLRPLSRALAFELPAIKQAPKPAPAPSASQPRARLVDAPAKPPDPCNPNPGAGFVWLDNPLLQ
jgi:hypothetical protein